MRINEIDEKNVVVVSRFSASGGEVLGVFSNEDLASDFMLTQKRQDELYMDYFTIDKF